MKIETFDVEGSDVEHQVYQSEASEEQAKLDCMNYDAADVEEDCLVGSYLFVEVWADIVDVERDFVVSGKFVGRGIDS